MARQNQRFRIYVVKDLALLDNMIQDDLTRFMGWKITHIDVFPTSSSIVAWAIWELQPLV